MEKLPSIGNGVLDLKASTTSSLYIDETMQCPKVQGLLMAISTLLSTQVSEEMAVCADVLLNPDFSCFCEEKYFAEHVGDFDPAEVQRLREAPTAQTIFEFLDQLRQQLKFK